jgi:hypothetical protein
VEGGLSSTEGGAGGQAPGGWPQIGEQQPSESRGPSSIDVGAVARRTFQIYVDQAPVLMPAAAVVFAISGVLRVVLTSASPGLGLLGLLISLVATTLFTGMVVELVADVQDSRRAASAGRLLRAVMPVLGQLLLVGIAEGVGVLVGLILLVIPGLILLTVWAVAAPVVVLERPGGLRALGRSRELVRGNGWNVFAVILLLVLLVAVLTAALELGVAAASATAGLVVMVVLGILAAPVSALAAAVLYFDLRHARERGGTPEEPGLHPFQAGTGL